MVLTELVGVAVRFGVTELLTSVFGPLGVVLFVLAVAGIRIRSLTLTGWALFLFVLLMVQA